MAKTKVKTAFYCQSCGNVFPKWQGQCSHCQEWNTIVEEVVENTSAVPQWVKSDKGSLKAKPKPISDIDMESERRWMLPDVELNRVLGGGLVPGSLILLGGEPGIGKSTLMLQLALQIKNLTCLYVSGEESEKQIKMRAERVEGMQDSCLIYTDINTQNILKHCQRLKPQILVIDSIQTLQTPVIDASPGSISQIRETAAELLRYAKETGTAIILIGHLTKDGMIAGPKILEHMVDVVLYFEGDNKHIYRILRARKNRFGPTAELGLYEMRENGLTVVNNPADLLLGKRDGLLSGTAISATIEGMRPMLIEIQALVSTAVYGTPQRTATGFDSKRLNMLLAVLEKRCGFKLGAKDVFLNITGGLKVGDPSIDLAVLVAILSSNEDQVVSSKIAFSGEIGLTGEIRPSSRVEQRISEAEKMGFDQIFISSFNKVDTKKYGIKVQMASSVNELYEALF